MTKNMQSKILYNDREDLVNIISPSLKNYNRHIASLILNTLRNKRKILDFGAGCGSLAKIIKASTKCSITCVEIDEKLKLILKKNGFVVHHNLEELKDQYDLIYSSNVLEHIYNDKKVVRSLKSKLVQNGILVLYLPAFQLLFSDLDRKVGHHRRYSKKNILKIADKTGFKIDNIFYVDSIGFFCTFLIKLFGWNTKNGLGSENSLKFYDRLIFPLSKILDSWGLKYILGKNIFVSLKKIK